MIYPVKPKDVAQVWGQAEPALQRAFELSEIDCAQAHFAKLVSDQEQLWCIRGKAWSITRVMPCKSGRLLEIVAMGGEGLNQWGAEFFEVVESWAASCGCSKVIFTGRPGWRKRAPGYREKRVTFVKEIVWKS